MHLFGTALAAAASFVVANGFVTVLPGGEPKRYQGPAGFRTSEAFFRESAINEFSNNSAQILMSSLDDIAFEGEAQILPSGGSFVRGAIQAWGEHLHLVLRPEEVWFTILVQMNFFMNAHAEELRSMFVEFDGRQVMYLEDTEWFRVIQDFKNEVQRRIKVPWLLDWVTPGFTTSGPNDGMVAAVLMMGLMKGYFKYEGGIICGLPSVTLLGELIDWEALLAKVDRLPAFGDEPAAYRDRLRPILTRFVESFKKPDSADTRLFWNQIVSASEEHMCGGPPYSVSGWITGFFFWDDQGKPFARDPGKLQLDKASYPVLDLRRLPLGYARAPFLMRDYDGPGQDLEAYVMGGTLGKQISNGPPEGYAAALRRANISAAGAVDASQHSTLQPMSQWLLYGPLAHNASTQAWVADPELASAGTLFSAIGKNFDAGQCALRAA